MIDPRETVHSDAPRQRRLSGNGTALRNGVIALLGILLIAIAFGGGRLAIAFSEWALPEWHRLVASRRHAPPAMPPVRAVAAPEPGRSEVVPSDLGVLPKARSIGSPANWMSPDDYPAEALRNNVEGKVGVSILVREDGTPERCFVRQSSGARVLDARTCGVIMERARFAPGADAKGGPSKSQSTLSFSWKIAE